MTPQPEEDARSLVERAEKAGSTIELVVGFDGSESAGNALLWAKDVRARSSAHIHVVYVAHQPCGTGLAVRAYADVQANLSAVARELDSAAEQVLGNRKDSWDFQRRDGSVAHELISLADEISSSRPDSTILLLIGTSAHAYPRVAGSVSHHLLHHSRYAVTVIPLDPGQPPEVSTTGHSPAAT